MRFVDLVQGTPEWVRWRAAGLGSADAAAIAGLSRWKTARHVWEVKRGLRPYPIEDERARGRLLEPAIRARYEEALGRPAPPRCCESEREPWLRASLDGWVEEVAIPVELKAAGRRDHRDALDGMLPIQHAPQCLHILLVTGRPFLHYTSWNAQFPPPRDLAVLRVAAADSALLDELRALERAFWQAVQDGAPPRVRPWKRADRATMARLVSSVSHVSAADAATASTRLA